MNKPYIEVVYNGEVVIVSPVFDCSPLEFAKKKKEADANFARVVARLLDRIKKLEKDIKILKGEE